MHLSAYQHAALRTLNSALSAQEQLVDAAAGLAEEAGEVLGVVRKHRFQGRTLDRGALAEELGDVLWCLAVVAERTGLTLDQVAEANLEKLRGRHPDGLRAPPATPDPESPEDLH
jgi:NTP pyrophosphatase (non-canonical NTP hydrolase)